MNKMETSQRRMAKAETETAPAPNLLHHLHRLPVMVANDAITVTWLALAAVLPFAHLPFGSRVVDPFLNVSQPMPLNWYVTYLCGALSSFCFAAFTFRAVNRKWKKLALMWLVYCGYDVLMFLWCFNAIAYYYIPYGLMLFVAFKIYK